MINSQHAASTAGWNARPGASLSGDLAPHLRGLFWCTSPPSSCSPTCSPGPTDETHRLDRPRRLPGFHRRLWPLPQPRQQHRRSLPAGRQDHALVRHGAFHHGHAGLRHHLHLHHRPILRGWHALCAVLFRTAHRHGDRLRHRRPDFHRAQSTPPTSTWKSASTRRPAPWPASSSCASAASRRSDHLRPRYRPVHHPGMARAPHHALHGRTVVTYTVLGGIKAVTWSDVQQMGDHLSGADRSLVTVIALLPLDVSFSDAVYLAGAAGRLNAVTTHFDWNDRFNLWSGLIGSTFLFLSYFGCDQSQVQRYLTGRSISKPPGSAVQCRGQNPDAVFHFVHRRHGVCVLRLRAAAVLV